jgi:predicted ester cyclase
MHKLGYATPGTWEVHMAIDIKQVSRKILEDVFGKGKLEYLDQVCDSSFKAHDPLTGDSDIAALKRDVQTYRAAFPDLTPTVLGLCAEGDTVCMLWRCTGTQQNAFMGVKPTGKKITVEGINFDRYRNGKLVESFSQWDTLHFLQELGVIPRFELGAPMTGAERRPQV